MHAGQGAVGVHPHMVIDKAAPVQQLHHGLKAEHGLAGKLSIIGDHACTCLQLDGLVIFCPGKLLKPDLQWQHEQGLAVDVAIQRLKHGKTETYHSCSFAP